MEPERKSGSFLDPKTIMAIVFCFGLMILWQNHLTKKYPDHYKQQAQKRAQDNNSSSQAEGGQEKSTPAVMGASGPSGEVPNVDPAVEAERPKEEVLLTYEDENFRFDVSSYGMGIRNVTLKNYKDRKGNLIKLSEESKVPLFASSWLNSESTIAFNLEKISENEFIGKAFYGQASVVKTLSVDPNSYTIETSIQISGDRGRIVGLKTSFNEKFEIEEGSIPLIPSYDINSFFIHHGTTTDRVMFALESEVEEGYSDVGVLSVDTHYFTRALVDNSKILPKVKVEFDGKSYASGFLKYDFPSGKDNLSINQKLFIGPKDRSLLRSADERLSGVLDLGMFSFIGNPILDLLQFFFKMFGNWGVAIILMTLVVRLLLLPFNVVSFKSMKKMQVIQPQLQALKEKYKDDKETLNQETMRLMKESGANPISGCLPMLLQFPVFIALFQVLGNAIELYQVPFVLWIDDLSVRDPYFVLPVLMAVTMVLQQKLSPTTPDATTKKAMMFVTIMFSALLVFYPSGLALYIFVGSLFSIVQQLILMRDTNPKTTEPVQAKA